MDKETSKRIWVTRYFMVIGIVVLHVPPYQPLTELGGSFFDFVKGFFSHGVFRATVPVLTVLSGYLLFSSNLKFQPLKILEKKTSSLLVPLILWNIPLVLAIYFSQKFHLIPHEFSAKLYPFEPVRWLNAITGFLGTPANYPLSFLRDLFALSLLAPLYWFVLSRAPYLGIALVLVVYYFNLDGPIVLRNSMLVSYYLGGLAASQSWNLTTLDRHAKWFAGAFLVFCAVIVIFDIRNRELFRFVSPFLVWPAMSLIVDSRFGEFLRRNAKYSFFTFLAHGPILLILWFAWKVLPFDLPYPIYWILAPCFTVYLAIATSKFLEKYFPRVLAFVLGGR